MTVLEEPARRFPSATALNGWFFGEVGMLCMEDAQSKAKAGSGIGGGRLACKLGSTVL